jgi:hypothetical protein
MIILMDLIAMEQSGSLSPEDQEMLRLMELDMNEIGHVIDSRAIPVITGAGGMVAVIHTYGVTRDELESYPQRIRQAYEKVFGSRLRA